MRKLALLLVVAPLALAACGGSSTSAPAIDPVAYVKHSAQKTAQTGSEHMTLDATVSAAGQSISMKGSGDYVNKPLQSTMDMSVSLMGRNVHFNGVQDGTVMYIRSSLITSQLPAGKTWMKLDLAKFGQSHGINFSSLMSRSPAQAMEQVEAAGSVKSMGAETIDGVETTHYQVTKIDVSKLPQGAKLKGLANVSYGPIDVWIGNKDGYIYRESASFTVSVHGQSSTTSMQADFSKFGETVNVSVPPASEVFDATNMAGMGMGT